MSPRSHDHNDINYMLKIMLIIIASLVVKGFMKKLSTFSSLVNHSYNFISVYIGY